MRLSAYPPDEGAFPHLAGDAEVREYVDTATARTMLQALVDAAAGLLPESQGLWQLWMDWELRILAAAKGNARWVPGLNAANVQKRPDRPHPHALPLAPADAARDARRDIERVLDLDLADVSRGVRGAHGAGRAAVAGRKGRVEREAVRPHARRL